MHATSLTERQTLYLGKFTWLPGVAPSTSAEMLGDFLDREELAVALRVMRAVADTYDERLRELLGGRLPHID